MQYGICMTVGLRGEGRGLNADKLVKITFLFNFISRLSGQGLFIPTVGKWEQKKEVPTVEDLSFPYSSLFFPYLKKACDDLKKLTKQNYVHCFTSAFSLVSKLHLFHVH